MSLSPWDPFRSLETTGREMNNFLENSPFSFFGKSTAPRVDVYQTEKEFIVKAEIPGVSKEDLNVYVDENSIRLSGETKRDNDYKDEHTFRAERYYGSFSRTIPLPVEVVSDKARADYKDGILSIVVPKVEPSNMRGRKIDIQ
ncbi:MAG: Hsp20/alpha crystallin family protein [Clostridia bacterium]|nr:Hsp20/alpha crystallin family protein [Clostridia bacterium]